MTKKPVPDREIFSDYVANTYSPDTDGFNLNVFKKSLKYHINLYILNRVHNAYSNEWKRDLENAYWLIRFGEIIGINDTIMTFAIIDINDNDNDNLDFDIILSAKKIIKISKEILSKRTIEKLDYKISQAFKIYSKEQS